MESEIAWAIRMVLESGHKEWADIINRYIDSVYREHRATVERFRDRAEKAEAQLTTYSERMKALEAVLEAKQQLLVCYRLGKQPSERLLNELSRSGDALAALDTTGGAE